MQIKLIFWILLCVFNMRYASPNKRHNNFFFYCLSLRGYCEYPIRISSLRIAYNDRIKSWSNGAMNKQRTNNNTVRRSVRSPISSGSSSATFLFSHSHLDNGDHNESFLNVHHEVSSRRGEILWRTRGGETSLGSVDKRRNGQAYLRMGFKIDILFMDIQLRSLREKITEDFGTHLSLPLLSLFLVFLPFFSFTSFYRERQLLRLLARTHRYHKR